MDEIEIEIKIKPKNAQAFFSWLNKNAKLIKSSRQIDYYLDPPHKTFLFTDKTGKKTADDYLRVRVDKKGGEVTYKHYHRELEGKERPHLDEIESEIDKPEKLLKIFKRLGFRLCATIDKARTSYRYKNFQFDCDEVRGLGTFIEIELKEKVDNPKKGFEKIHKLLKEIGIKEWDDARGGYVEMYWNRKS